MTARGPTGHVSLEALLEHRNWVRALARSLVADPHRADDVEQETWRMAIERPPQHGGSLRSWFRAVVRNAARKSGRGDAQRARLEASAPRRPGTPSPADVLAEAEINARLVRAVLELDEPYGSTVLYRYFHGLEPHQIAEQIGAPVETVKTRLKRAIARLRERMGEELGDDRDAWCLLVLGLRPHGSGAAGAAATGSAAKVLGGGVVAMTTTSKLGIAACMLLVAAGAWWFARPGAGDGTASTATSHASAASDGDPASRAVARARSIAHVGGDSAPHAQTAAPRLRGHVVDPDGRPAPGVRVVLLAGTRTGGPPVDVAAIPADSSAVRETRADVSGAFSADAFATMDVASAIALRDDGALGLVPAIRAGEDVTIQLTAPASIVGRVTDSAGSPVPRAHVVAGLLLDRARLVRETTAATDGTYRVAGVPARPPATPTALVTFQLEFTAEGFAPKLVPMTGFDALAAAEERRIDVRLLRGATLVGTVVEAETGVPVGGASLALVSEEGRMGFDLGRGRSVENPFAPRTLGATESGADGAFRFEHVPVAEGAAAFGRLGVGSYRVAIGPTAWFVDPNPSFAAADRAIVDVTSGTGEFRADARCVPAGAVSVELTDRRLPISGLRCDDAKWRFGAESVSEIRDASGRVLHLRRGLRRTHAFRNLVLPVGSYLVRIVLPGGETVERPFDVVAGKAAAVTAGGR